MGYLTGALRPETRFDPEKGLRSGFDRFTPEALADNKPVLDELEDFARAKNTTRPALALAWLLAQKPVIVPIPGARNPVHLAENLTATSLTLTPAELAEMDAQLFKLDVHGGRMNALQMKVVE